MQILRANGIPMDGTIDIRSNPAVREQVLAIARRSGAAQPAAAAPVPPPAPAPPPGPPPAPVPTPFMVQPPGQTTAQRLQELETLRATGSISEAEYSTKREQILSEL